MERSLILIQRPRLNVVIMWCAPMGIGLSVAVWSSWWMWFKLSRLNQTHLLRDRFLSLIHRLTSLIFGLSIYVSSLYFGIRCIQFSSKDIVKRKLAKKKKQKIFPLSQRKWSGIMHMVSRHCTHSPRKGRSGLFHAHPAVGCYTCNVSYSPHCL